MMKLLIGICIISFFIPQVYPAIRRSSLLNKLGVKPVGASVNDNKDFLPLSYFAPPPLPDGKVPATPANRRYDHGNHVHYHGHRRVNQGDCDVSPTPRVVHQGPEVMIVDEYYDIGESWTVATVLFPTHIDNNHFQVTTPIPYLTVGTIPGLGFHPTTSNPDECEKIYQDFLALEYSEESISSESVEYQRVPVNVISMEVTTKATTTLDPCDARTAAETAPEEEEDEFRKSNLKIGRLL